MVQCTIGTLTKPFKAHRRLTLHWNTHRFICAFSSRCIWRNIENMLLIKTEKGKETLLEKGILARCTVLHLFECNQLLCSEVAACPSERLEINRSLFRFFGLLRNLSELVRNLFEVAQKYFTGCSKLFRLLKKLFRLLKKLFRLLKIFSRLLKNLKWMQLWHR